MLRRKGLSRSAALRRVAIVRRHVYTGPSAATRSTVRTRAGHSCEWPGCGRVGTDYHHRLNRKMGGRGGMRREQINQPAWLLLACRAHHDRVTSACGRDLLDARHAGWVLTESQDAAEVAVHRDTWTDTEIRRAVVAHCAARGLHGAERDKVLAEHRFTQGRRADL